MQLGEGSLIIIILGEEEEEEGTWIISTREIERISLIIRIWS